MSRENEGEDEARQAGDEPPFAFEDVWLDDRPFPLTDAECARLVPALRPSSVRFQTVAHLCPVGRFTF